MAMRKSGKFCEEHGGTVYKYDRGWLCDVCAIQGYNKCTKCGGNARGFGEAMFSMVGCEDCDESVSGVGVNTRELWNQGVRGNVDREK